jgi:aryl-alcohol dehydrogenase-like predicted oxidoreductase
MHLSVLGFGCGTVGELMVRGHPADQERTIASAIAAGVNYFDTAVQYGDGESEKNLGRVLHNLKASNAIVGTKVRLPSAEFGRMADTVATSLEGQLGATEPRSGRHLPFAQRDHRRRWRGHAQCPTSSR